MGIIVEGKEVEFKKLDSTPPPGATERSVMTMEATVEVKQQPLRTIRPEVSAVGRIPALLPAEARFVLIHMLRIFVEKAVVKEGTFGDLVFGCQNGIPPLPAALSVRGIVQLKDAGFLIFQAPDNETLSIDADRIEDAWLKYTPRLLDLIYETPQA